MSEELKAIARAEFEIWSNGKLDGLDALVADDVLHHDPYDPYAAEGLKGLKRSIAANRETFPDLRIAIDDQVAEGDRVVTRWTATMTHAASGKSATVGGITMERFEGGKIVESWRSMDTLGLLRAIGSLPD